MFENLEIMRIAKGLASHAAARQSVVAQNIANADTPGYRARDVASFEKTFRADGGTGLRATRSGHLDFAASGYVPPAATVAQSPASPNGNSVSLETEMVNAVAVKKEYDLALAVYRSSMDILRASIGRR